MAKQTVSIADKPTLDSVLELVQTQAEQITALQEAIAKIPTTGGSQKVLKLSESNYIGANTSKTFTANNGGELHVGEFNAGATTFVVDGIAVSSAYFIYAERSFVSSSTSYGLRIPFKNNIKISLGSGSVYYSLYKYE